MSVISAIFSGIGAFFLSLWGLFTYWLWIFLIPFTSIESIWLIVPVWLSWFFAEFFQEKEGTSFGNAISNGVVPLWAGIDWMRQVTQALLTNDSPMGFMTFLKYFVSLVAVVFGLIIIIAGIKGRDYVHFAGRIRVVTYFVIMLTPLIYDLVRPNFNYFIAMLLFFPVFYIFIEFIDKKTPKPKAIAMDESERANSKNNFQSDSYMQQKSPYATNYSSQTYNPNSYVNHKNSSHNKK
jgi:hypothetical protein